MDLSSVYKLELDTTGGLPGGEIYAWGGASLIGQRSIGVCGSRNASETGLELAEALGTHAAETGLVVVSGYASGVDQRAHLGALLGGGATIAVLAEGMQHFDVRVALRSHVTNHNFLAVSAYSPDSRWTVGRAMQRNKLILSLVDAMFVVEAGEKGGTLAAGMDALRRGKPLFVLQFKENRPSAAGNTVLIQKGASVIGSRRELKEALRRVLSGDLMATSPARMLV